MGGLLVLGRSAMQPVPPPQPTPQPVYAQPRPGWGRFWLGVLAGGCGVLLLAALAFVILLVAVGSALNSAVHQGGGSLPGLPGGLPIPSSLPGISQRSDPCSPQPCMAHGGVTVLVGGVTRDAGPASESGSHLVRVQLTFAGTAGTHTVTPEEVAIRDGSGSMTLAGVDQAAAACGDATVSQDVAAGQRAGPYTVCYSVSGAANAPLTLVWVDPEDLSLVELKLP